MKLLLDENLPPSLVSKMEEIGHTCRHIQGSELSGKSDISIVEFAEREDWIIVTHDLDFSRIISVSGRKKPSVITFRLDKINTAIIVDLLTSNLLVLEDKLMGGALVTISTDKIRFQYLPLTRD